MVPSIEIVRGRRLSPCLDGRCYFRPESMALIDALVPIEEEGQPLMLAS